MKREKTDGKEYTEGISVEKSKFLRWLDNYWYHYKWVTIIVAFFLIVGVICTVQMCSREKEDITVVYAGRNSLSVNTTSDISRVLEAIAPEDFDGDGNKNIVLTSYYIMSEQQIKELQQETDENGDPLYVDTNYNSKQFETYSNYIMTGESSVLFLDPWLYESLKSADRLAKVEDIVGYVPDSACGEYGVRLGDTALYDTYDVMKLMHEDTVICILRPYVAGNSSKEDYYARETAMFEALVTFGEEDE